MKIPLMNLFDNKYNLELISVPLRIWTPDWPIPNRLKLEKYKKNVNTNHKTNINLIRNGLWGSVEKILDFKKRTYRDKLPSMWGKGRKSGRRFEYQHKKGTIWIKILSKFNYLDISKRILSFDRTYLRMSLMQDEIALWYISGEGQVRFMVLPRFIDLNEEFFELIGILDGEMCKKKSNKGGSSVKISNAEPVIIKKILNELNKIFKIPIDSWAASLTINSKGLKNYNEKKFRCYWSKMTNIKLERFTKTTIQTKYFSKFSDSGIIQIRYSNSLFFLLLMKIMENIRSIILKNTKFCEAYLRGISAAEGGIGKRGKKLRIFHIGGVKDKDKEFYIKCLKRIGITSVQKYKLRVEICGLDNFLRLKTIDILKYHPKRKKSFLDSLNELERNYKKKASQS